MNTRILLTSALLAAGLVVSANAQTSFTEGDLYVGVRVNQNSALSVNSDLIVDLGSANNFFQGVGGAIGNTVSALTSLPTVNTWDLSSDLTTQFGGTGWQTAGNGLFSIVGSDFIGTTNAPGANWVAAPNGQTLAQSTQSNENVFDGAINQYTNLNTGVTKIGSLNAALILKSAAGSYTSAVQIAQPNTFGPANYFGVGLETDTASGKSAALWELDSQNQNAVELGYFTLNSSGMLSFTLTPIPEPSTYAMILGVAALGFVMLRRRKQVTA